MTGVDSSARDRAIALVMEEMGPGHPHSAEQFMQAQRAVDALGGRPEVLRALAGEAGAPDTPPAAAFSDELARALHDEDCGCGDYDETEDPRYINTVRAVLARRTEEQP